MILQGDCRERMAEMEENSIDAIVCDPPYELGFMGKKWDGSGIAYDQEVWRQAWRVLKPGGYLLAFGGTRTYHRLACAIEDAGFVLHPMIGWCFGSGFPKATNLSKMLDKAAGAEREIRDPITATDAARQWDGWYYGKQSLKPALEPICMAQKPPDGKMVLNVEKWECGVVNIDASRIGTDEELRRSVAGFAAKSEIYQNDDKYKINTFESAPPSGRWPANLILGHAPGCVRRGEGETVADWDCVEGCPVKMIGEQSGRSASNIRKVSRTELENDGHRQAAVYGKYHENRNERGHDDEGTAARFFLNIDPDPLFYCAKASRAERNRGLEGMNHHPTVKPLKLMRYLVRLVTPPGGTVLDPFAGSGTTLIAAKEEGFRYIGIELEPEYVEIAEARLAAADRPPATLEDFVP